MNEIIFPPRPKSAIPPKELPYYEKTGLWCAQPKYNGSRSVILITPEHKVFIYGRHGRVHLNYTMPTNVAKEILELPGLKPGLKYWLDGELLVKTTAKDTKGKIVLFDILQVDKYLFLKYDQLKRLQLLSDVCGNPTKLDPLRGMGYTISENLLMAPTFFSDLKVEFEKSYSDEVEGLVLRKKDSVLDNFGQKEYLVNWLLRCRKSHKNYEF
jgi:ATP-dependent DNA ligase